MQIITRAEFVWSTKQDRYLLVRKLSINRTEIALCKGASAQQQDLANSQQAFYNQLTQDYSTQFANQSAILNSINGVLNPIIKAGPNQFGFSTGETNTLNSAAIQGTGQQYANASKALKEQQAATGGGNAFLPSGVSSQQQQQLASGSANQASSELLGIQNAGWQQGTANFNNAVNQEMAAAGLYNPTGYSSSATGAGQAAGSELNTITQENNAASPWGVIGGLLGGAAGIAGDFLGMPGIGGGGGGSSSVNGGASQSPYGSNSD